MNNYYSDFYTMGYGAVYGVILLYYILILNACYELYATFI